MTIAFQKNTLPLFHIRACEGGQQLLAGLLVTKFMHTNALLGLVNVAEASLSRFLEVALRVLHDPLDETHSPEALNNTIYSL
ncbi:hypothetical protein ACFX2K_036667 [Malus domestica]